MLTIHSQGQQKLAYGRGIVFHPDKKEEAENGKIQNIDRRMAIISRKGLDLIEADDMYLNQNNVKYRRNSQINSIKDARVQVNKSETNFSNDYKSQCFID